MIRRLRWKFTGVMTVICALFLSGILLSLYYTSRVNFQQGCLGILQAVLMDDGEHPDPPQAPGGWGKCPGGKKCPGR